MRMAALVCVTGASLGVASFAESHWDTPIAEKDIAFRPVQSPKHNYVTSDTCKACHPGQYESWHRSYHRTMTQPATPENVIGNFNNVSVQAYGETYLLTREGDRFFADTPNWKQKNKDGSHQRIRHELVMLTGSHHMQVYWYNQGPCRNLRHFDLVYVKETESWVPRLSTFITPPARDSNPAKMGSAEWEQACIPCHVTDGKPRIHRTQGTADTTMAEFGIACESCHGEAGDHVAKHKNPLVRYGSYLGDGDDTSIVHPENLKVRQSSQICGQCHSLRAFMDAKLQVRWKHGGGDPYRPGKELEDTELVFQFPHPRLRQAKMQDFVLKGIPGYTAGSFWPDGMVRVVGREYNMLLKTPCYNEREEENPFTCMSCHAMHTDKFAATQLDEWADDQLKVGMRTNEACFQCHETFREKLTEHTHHEEKSSGSLCYNCHMPPTTYGLFKAVMSHRITSPNVEDSLNTGRHNACTNCHVNRTLSWASVQLNAQYGQPMPMIHPELDEAAFNVVLLLQGDAAQRALAAWAMGWDAAMEASGRDWQPPILAELLDDPYDAVRFIAHRSLRQFSPFENLEYNFVDSADALARAQIDAREVWSSDPNRKKAQPGHATLTAEDGSLLIETLENILRRRDDAPIDIAE